MDGAVRQGGLRPHHRSAEEQGVCTDPAELFRTAAAFAIPARKDERAAGVPYKHRTCLHRRGLRAGRAHQNDLRAAAAVSPDSRELRERYENLEKEKIE